MLLIGFTETIQQIDVIEFIKTTLQIDIILDHIILKQFAVELNSYSLK